MMTQVETTAGPIEGREKDGTFFFASIPYAAEPTESRRFQIGLPFHNFTLKKNSSAVAISFWRCR